MLAKLESKWILIVEKAFVNVVCGMADILFQPLCVNTAGTAVHHSIRTVIGSLAAWVVDII